LARKIISNILAGRLEIGIRGRYYIDREVGQFQTRCTPPNMTLSWDTGGALRDK